MIGSPNDSHAPLARKAMAARLNVVIDKPIAVRSPWP
ncbi:Gfo/Idh/MocA family oxidoreductase [Arthrobacter sp. M4]|nr:Gfo/Idh/MocA family oxidoreductase [Arthrobacter sp. M4]